MTSEPMPAQDSRGAIDSGLGALVMLLRIHGIGADADQIRHQFGGARVGVPEMLRAAKDFGLKARVFRTRFQRLAELALPGIAAKKNGDFLVVGRAGDDKVLVQEPGSPRPTVMTDAEFQAVWDGRIILMSRRAGLGDLTRRFDITWFLGAIQKYRGLLTEVLVASFFLQLFALVTPLFFQVIIDKVLV
ncbi:MAG: cysteine peptidase family C39 domain-containing protein, partial [Stellaceae bacterium]